MEEKQLIEEPKAVDMEPKEEQAKTEEQEEPKIEMKLKEPIPEKRSLTKNETGTYKLEIYNEEKKLTIIQEHTKEELKDIYNNNLKPQMDGLTENNKQVLKQLKKIEEVEENEAIKELKKNLELLQKVEQKKGLEKQKENIQKDLEKVRKHMMEISTAIPELLRNK